MNLSQQKRERLLNFIKELKSNNSFDEKSLIELNEIENELNGKKYGLVWEEHQRIKGTVYLNPKVGPNNYIIKIIGGLIFYEVHI